MAERGRSLGVVLFAAEQFWSAIHDRVTGNCSTHVYGRTNSIEVTKSEYKSIPSVYKTMMTRLKQGDLNMQPYRVWLFSDLIEKNKRVFKVPV